MCVCVQGSASECVLVTLLAARHAAIKDLKNKFPFVEEGVLLSRLVAYCSKLVSVLTYIHTPILNGPFLNILTYFITMFIKENKNFFNVAKISAKNWRIISTTWPIFIMTIGAYDPISL